MTQQSSCSVERLDNGIFVFTMLSDHRSVVDEYFVLASDVVEHMAPDEPALFIIDIPGSRMPSFKYMTYRSQGYYNDHPGVSERLRIAFLSDNFERKIAETMLNLIRASTTRRFFQRSERAEAERWLLEGDG